MKKTLTIFIMLFLVSCAQSEDAIRDLGARESMLTPKSYGVVYRCAERALSEKYEIAMYFKQDNQGARTIIYRDEYNGGYFVQVDRQNDGSAKVSTYVSNNIMFAKELSARLMWIVKSSCF